MRSVIIPILHAILTFFHCLKPSGTKALIAENIALRHQLMVLTRGKHRAPKMTRFDRFYFGLLAAKSSPLTVYGGSSPNPCGQRFSLNL